MDLASNTSGRVVFETREAKRQTRCSIEKRVREGAGCSFDRNDLLDSSSLLRSLRAGRDLWQVATQETAKPNRAKVLAFK